MDKFSAFAVDWYDDEYYQCSFDELDNVVAYVTELQGTRPCFKWWLIYKEDKELIGKVYQTAYDPQIAVEEMVRDMALYGRVPKGPAVEWFKENYNNDESWSNIVEAFEAYAEREATPAIVHALT